MTLKFYSVVLNLLDTFYPESFVTITSRDPSYMTADVKAMLRRKNRLMRKGRGEEASALARRIGNEITRHTTQLSLVHENVDSREMWACVRRLTGKNQNFDRVEGTTVESLNDHYSQISTDHDYTPPALKQTVLYPNNDCISEWRVFNILDMLCSTATGLDGIPSWFLRVAAPIFCSPISCSTCCFPPLRYHASGNKPGFTLYQRLRLLPSIQIFGQYQ